MSLLLSGAHVVTMDDTGSEHEDGWVLLGHGRVEEVGGGVPPAADERVDLGGAVVTPGLVKTHHHLYQTLTRARAQEADLFTSMDLGESDGGLPPDALVESMDDVLAETERLATFQDDGFVQIAVAPCSPSSVTAELMRESALLARRLGLVLHTHLAETVEEEAYCRELFGCAPVEYLDSLGWLDGDVWCAHCVHLLQPDVRRFADTDTGVAHCPTSNLRLGAGVAPVSDLLDAGVRVGLGVDGSASNERGEVDRLYVEGEEIVRDARLVRADEEEIARLQRAQARRFAP